MRILIVGTGTHVGKTHVSASLLAYARSLAPKVRAIGYKPVATGVDAVCDDAACLAEASGEAYMHPTFAYERPVSPHLAAREEGRPVDLARIRHEAAALGESYDVVIVEFAGGLFSPLGDVETNADLVQALGPARVLLVAPDRIGVLHDVIACVRAASAAALPIHAVALSTPHLADASTGSNAAELAKVGRLRVPIVTFPHAAPAAAATLAAAARAWAALNATSPK